jgi:hypothetical protein
LLPFKIGTMNGQEEPESGLWPKAGLRHMRIFLEGGVQAPRHRSQGNRLKFCVTSWPESESIAIL